MQPYVLEIEFLEVIWWLIMIFAWTLFLWMFIATFTDIFRRHDISGWAKAFWILLIIILPVVGIIIYVVARPRDATLEQDMALIEQQRRLSRGMSPVEEIARAQELLGSGAITQEEFDQLKKKALATP